MKNYAESSESILDPESACMVVGGNNIKWAYEALKLVIAYWGSIKTGFADGYGDYMDNIK